MEKFIYQCRFDDLSQKVQKIMQTTTHLVNQKPIHTLDFLYNTSFEEDMPFYVKNRLKNNSPSSYAHLQKYINEIEHELSAILFLDPTLKDDFFSWLVRSLQSLKLHIQSFVVSTEKRLNIYFLDKLIDFDDSILLLVCREKLKYYKVMSYMNLETELANEYIQKIESAICKKHGQESLLYFDQKKEEMLWFDTQFGNNYLSLDRCIALWKQKFAKNIIPKK